MRIFLLSLFWWTNIGSMLQIFAIAVSIWIVSSGAYSFSELNLSVLISEYVPWLVWIKSVAIAILGDFGRWIVTIPVVVIASVKIVTGTIIGLWAYSVAKGMPKLGGINGRDLYDS